MRRAAVVGNGESNSQLDLGGQRPPSQLRRRFAVVLLGAVGLVSTVSRAAQPEAAVAPGQILQDLRTFNTVGTVLHIAAHPDDENTALITYLARGRGLRTGYLSLTRGDGGQNEIGPEFDEKLGVARTQELLAARRHDGGRQFFTRAIDFGYSKTPEETLKFWDREQVLGDVVRIVRQFRPDVIVTRFPVPPRSGGHGHHTASGMLGLEAFTLAADPKAYPEQLKEGLTVWQPKRVVWNAFGGGGPNQNAPQISEPNFEMEIAGLDPATGEQLGVFSNRSRGMHVTQGFLGWGDRPPQTTVKARFAHFGGEPATSDLMDGVVTTWARVPGGAEIGAAADKIIAEFKAESPAASVPALLALRAKLAGVAKGDPVVDDKRAELDRIIAHCLGLTVKTTAEIAEVVPGETLELRYEVNVAADVVPVALRGVSTNAVQNFATQRTVKPGVPLADRARYAVPADLPVTQPYWLREEPAAGIARVSDTRLIGLGENPRALPVTYAFAVGDQTIEITDEPMYVAKAEGERTRRVDVIPPVTLRFLSNVSLFTPGAKRTVEIEAIAARQNVSGSLQLELPNGWSVSPAKREMNFSRAGEKRRFSFEVTAPVRTATGRMTAVASIGGKSYSHQRTEINYPHIPLQLLQPPARARLVSTDVAVKGRQVGYLPGAGDATVEALEQLGYAVTTLTGADLTTEKLKALDAVVVGVRAFNERTDLKDNVAGLFAYAENGGTVIVQYNRPNGLPQGIELGPYKIAINGPAPRLRVTDEKSPVTFLAPEHPVLNSPNKIGAADFEGWYQERGAYFPSSWDKENYAEILALNDPDEEPLTSGLLVARHGQGYFVYTGLAFFRQLPGGVPGGYRLLANLVSLGK